MFVQKYMLVNHFMIVSRVQRKTVVCVPTDNRNARLKMAACEDTDSGLNNQLSQPLT
jgi:hypothetical protein